GGATGRGGRGAVGGARAAQAPGDRRRAGAAVWPDHDRARAEPRRRPAARPAGRRACRRWTSGLIPTRSASDKIHRTAPRRRTLCPLFFILLGSTALSSYRQGPVKETHLHDQSTTANLARGLPLGDLLALGTQLRDDVTPEAL